MSRMTPRINILDFQISCTVAFRAAHTNKPVSRSTLGLIAMFGIVSAAAQHLSGYPAPRTQMRAISARSSKAKGVNE
jgi:hypothetical protein